MLIDYRAMIGSANSEAVGSGSMGAWIGGSSARFYAAAAIVVSAAVLAAGAARLGVSTELRHQGDRNAYLEEQIARVDGQIDEIKRYKRLIELALGRAVVVKHLAEDANGMVRIFNFLARGVPDGAYLRFVHRDGQRVSMRGYASSPARVTLLLRNVEASELLREPNLTRLKAVAGSELFEFQIVASLGSPADDRSADADTSASGPRTPEAPTDVPLATPPAEAPSWVFGWVLVGVVFLALVASVFRLRRRSRSPGHVARRSSGARMESAIRQFEAVDPRRIETWGPAPRLVVMIEVLLLTLAAAHWWILSPGLDELEWARDKELELRQQFLDKKKLAVNLDLYRDQLREMEEAYDVLLKRLPSKTVIADISRSLTDAASARGIEVLTLQPDQSEQVSDFYAEFPVLLRLAGSFDALGAVAGDLAKSVRLVSAGDFKLASRTEFGSDAGGPSNGLLLGGKIRFPRYLDEEEVAAQRRSARAKRGKR